MKKLVLVSLSLFLLTACAPKSTVIEYATDPFTEEGVRIPADRDEDSGSGGVQVGKSVQKKERLKIIEESLNNVLEGCRPVLAGLESKSKSQAQTALWVSISGIFAGAVAAPYLLATSSANAATAAGLSGFAGATNFANQALISSGLSGAESSSRRNMIVKKVGDEIEAAILAFSDDNDADGSIGFKNAKLALLKAQAGCLLYEISIPTVSTK